jgi:SAM-dependent methyltransferase
VTNSTHHQGPNPPDVADTAQLADVPTGDERNTKLYRNRFDAEDRQRKDEVWRIVVEDFLQRWVKPTDTVLDIGCGYGEFLNHIKCARRIGVDLNTDGRDSLAPDVEFHTADVRDLAFLDAASVDVVFTSNLMEHLPSKHDVEAMLVEVRRVLQPGGHLIAMGPNIRFVAGAYWDFWDHLTPITDRSLVELLEHLDYSVEDCYPKFLPYTTRSSIPQALWLVRGYVKFPPAWRVMGKQFLIRARRD